MNTWNFVKFCFGSSLALALLGGLIIAIFPEFRETMALFTQVALIVGLLPIGSVIAVCLITEAAMSICGFVKKMLYWPQEKSWGHVFTALGIIGLAVLMCVDGNDVMRSTSGSDWGSITILITATFGLLGLGWLINHWPKQRRVLHIEFPGGWSEELEP